MKKYTISINFTDTIEAEDEDKALETFWNRVMIWGIATVENVEEVEEKER